ncbi:hypothetical protein OPV22_005696 [Ensete ventricosum]|uniref:Uncharacterized protein n=1 Tax=Ensete ventricosum TaxID=4639 RepID=A0AAV8RS14_ENSVE|nr:hypothetical protein OPV22_005696 [Ensete ventricosum]
MWQRFGPFRASRFRACGRFRSLHHCDHFHTRFACLLHPIIAFSVHPSLANPKTAKGEVITTRLSHEGAVISEEAIGKAYQHLLMRVRCLVHPQKWPRSKSLL